MSSHDSRSVTQLLQAACDGDYSAANRFWQKVMDELLRLARAQLAREGDACRIDSTSRVNQAFQKLTDGEPIRWENRRLFYAAAAKAMRRILIDRARERNRQKRGGGMLPVALNEEPCLSSDPMDRLALLDAVELLEAEDPRRA